MVSVLHIDDLIHFKLAVYKSHETLKNNPQAVLYILENKIFINNASDVYYKDEHGAPKLKNNEGFISVSHTKNFIAVLHSTQYKTGIDIEYISHKAKKVNIKFLSLQEHEDIQKKTNILSIHELYTLCWATKEAVYKCFSEEKLNFIKNIRIIEILNNPQTVKVQIHKGELYKNIQVHYQIIDDIILAYCFDK